LAFRFARSALRELQFIRTSPLLTGLVRDATRAGACSGCAGMEKATETWVTGPDRLVSATRRDACVVPIYPPGPAMGTPYPLTDTPVVLGRGNDCDIRINDHSVSRRHARIQPGADGYYAVDLQSTNGTFVNDVPASICKLKDGDYLRVGNCI